MKDITINTDRYEIYKRGKLLKLSKMQYYLLKYFIEHEGVVLTREQLIKDVWEYEIYNKYNNQAKRVVDVLVRRTREIIEDDPSNPKYLITKRGFGYCFINGQEGGE